MEVTLERALAELDGAELSLLTAAFAAMVPWSLERGAPRRASVYAAVAAACRHEEKRRRHVLTEWAAALADDHDAGEIVTDLAAHVEEARRQLREGDG